MAVTVRNPSQDLVDSLLQHHCTIGDAQFLFAQMAVRVWRFGCAGVCLLQSQVGGPPDVWRQLPSALWSIPIENQQKRIRLLQLQLPRKQSDAAALLEQQKAAQTHAGQPSATLSEQHAAAEADAAALWQQHAEAQAELIELQQQQALSQAQVVGLLQQQRRADAVRLKEQQEEAASLREQAEAGQAQIAQLQGQVASLQAALLERQG